MRRDILEMEIGIRQPEDMQMITQRFQTEIRALLIQIARAQKIIKSLDKTRAQAVTRLEKYKGRLADIQRDLPNVDDKGAVSARESTSDIMRKRHTKKQQRLGIVGDPEKK
jgi:chromosome segregation ATPase